MQAACAWLQALRYLKTLYCIIIGFLLGVQDAKSVVGGCITLVNAKNC